MLMHNFISNQGHLKRRDTVSGLIYWLVRMLFIPLCHFSLIFICIHCICVILEQKKQNNCQNNCVYLELHNTIKIISTKKCDGFYLQLYPRSLFSFFYLQHKLLEVSSVQLFLFQLKQTQSRLLQIIHDAFCHQEVLTSGSEELHAQQLRQGKATWILGEDRYNNHLCCTLSACNLPNQS